MGTAAGILAWAPPAEADPIPGVGSIQDLINLNVGSATDGVAQGGLILNGLRFYDFNYSSTGTDAPTAAEVAVQTAPGPSGDLGLSFSFDWVSVGGTSNMVSTIRYKVHLEAGPPSGLDRVGLFFDGDVPLTSAFAQVSETVRDLSGVTLGTLGVFDDGAGAGQDVSQNFLTLATPQQDLDLSKAIRVNSRSTGIATISFVDNTFRVGTTVPNGLTVVPMPTAAWGGMALLGILGAFHWRSRKSSEWDVT
jgi:hypothetical protein